MTELPINYILHLVIANRPRLLREMLGKILGRCRQINIIGETDSTRRLPLIVELFSPDWIVLTLDENGAFPDVVEALIEKEPMLGILAITENGRRVRVRYRGITCEGFALKELIHMVSLPARTASICRQYSGPNGYKTN